MDPKGTGRNQVLRTTEMALLLLGSGACALVYQVIWTREFRLIFGGLTSATAAVLAVFTLGLGVGAYFLGKACDHSKNPLRLYAKLEVGVAAGALASPWVLDLAREAYLTLGGEVVLGSALATLARLILTTVVLGIPTFLMGGTLPAAVAAVGSDADPKRLRIALLYGVNTLGAVLGSLVLTFFALERFGTKQTLFAAVVLNAAVAAIALLRSSRLTPTGIPVGNHEIAPPGSLSLDALAPRGFILAAAFTTGFVFFVMELVWYRMLGPILGGTVFTFGLILAIVLLGIGLGGAAFSLTGLRSSPSTLGLFAATCAVEGFLVLLPFAAGDRIALLAASIRGLSLLGFGGAVGGWAVVTSLVALPAALVAGFQFPLMISLLGRGRAAIAQDTASTYVWNMAGGILGSLVGGFGALPLLSATGAWRLAGATMIALSLAATLLSRSVNRSAYLALTFLAFLPAFATGPTAVWRHSQIGVGRSGLTANLPPSSLDNLLATMRRATIWEADGVESSVALRTGQGVSFVVNGKIDGHATLDAGTQVMSGMLPAILHPSPRTAMVIGLGTGGTAGWLGAIPSMRSVDVCEIEPKIVEVAQLLRDVNEDVVSNPKVKIHLGDAREFLQTTPATYDIVISEPSNPYRAGIASLFAREYYVQIKKRMNPGAVFVQWLQIIDIDVPSFRRIFATVLSEFPHAQVYRTHTDLLILASTTPFVSVPSTVAKRLREEPFSRALAHGWWVNDINGFLAYYVGGQRLSEAVASEAEGLVTDDRNPLEFGFARRIGLSDPSILPDLRALAESLGESVPPGYESSVDRSVLAEHRAEVDNLVQGLGPEARARANARMVGTRGNLRGGYEMWRSQPGAPVTLRQAMFLAEAEAEVGEPEALKRAAAFPPGHEGEAMAVAARFFMRRGDGVRSVEFTRNVLQSMITTPWGETEILSRFLGLLPELSQVSPQALRVFGELVKKPFAGGALYEERFATWLTLATMEGSTLDCREPLRYYERSPPKSAEFHEAKLVCAAREGVAAQARAQKDADQYNRGRPQSLIRKPGVGEK